MNPTPEQVAQWASEAGDKDSEDPWQVSIWMLNTDELHRLVTRAMAEQAEDDAKLCGAEFWKATKRDGPAAGVAAGNCAAAIRANAPKVTT